MKVCIVPFSGRPGGNCSRIAEIIRQKEREAAVYDFSALSITPCGCCNYECFQQREKCPHFSDPEFTICEAIANSDLAYFIVPNYCDYPCANFFIFNERSQCYFQHREDLLNQYLAVRKNSLWSATPNRIILQPLFVNTYQKHLLLIYCFLAQNNLERSVFMVI